MIKLAKPYFDEEEIEEIQKVLDSGWVSQGPKTKEFEKKVTEYLGFKYCIAVTNCTSALHLSLLSIRIKEGDEVIVADYTFPATGHSVLYCGAKPVFVDVNPRTYNIEPDLIEDKITDKTKAIIPVHTFGQICDMNSIMSIARKHNLKVIEDAACSFGAKYDIYGDTVCFSFHARKGITTGEGGMVVTNDARIAENVRKLSTFGMTSDAWDREKDNSFSIPRFTHLGYNYKMSDITAAVGIAQLRKLDDIIKRKRELARYWTRRLEEIDFILSPYVDNEHVYQSYVITLDEDIDRNKLVEWLRTKGVGCQIGTYASHIQPVYQSEYNCPVSFDIYNQAIALPMYYELEEEDIDKVIHYLEDLEGFYN